MPETCAYKLLDEGEKTTLLASSYYVEMMKKLLKVEIVLKIG